MAAKVHIFTYSHNRPDFIEIQDKTFKKFLKDDYEFIVFNDASCETLARQIEKTCDDLRILCVRIPQEIHQQPYLERCEGENWNHPSVRNSNVVQYSLDILGCRQEGIVALFDSDLFLVRDFSIADFLKENHLAGIPQRREKEGKVIDYLWIGLCFLNMDTAPDANTLNFNCGRIDGVSVDAGGYTHYYLRNHPDARIKYLNHCTWPFFTCPACGRLGVEVCTHNTQVLLSEGFDEDQIAFIHSGPVGCEFMQDKCFMHYRAGTNWDYRTEEFHRYKTKILNEYIDSILKN